MAAKLIVCDHLDSDRHQLILPSFAKKYTVNDPRPIRITNCITSYVTGALQFLSVVEAKEFKGHVAYR